MPLEIPAYPSDIRRDLFLMQIARRPSVAVFRGQEVTVRFDEPSMSRKTELAGYADILDGLECMIALDVGADKPEPKKIRDRLESDNTTYQIEEVRGDQGLSCYFLTLTKIVKR